MCSFMNIFQKAREALRSHINFRDYVSVPERFDLNKALLWNLRDRVV